MQENKEKQISTEQFDELKDGIKDVIRQHNYKPYLNLLSSSNSYSLKNLIFLHKQNPHISMIGNKKFWEQNGRYITPDQQPLEVFYPVKENVLTIKTDKENRPLQNPDGTFQKEMISQITGFNLKPVFDISQTTGKELPKSPALELKGSSAEPTALLNILEKTIPASNKEIDLSALNAEQRCKLLIHEHVESKLQETLKNYNPENPLHKMQADSTKYIISNNLGLNTAEYSFHYVTDLANTKASSTLEKALNNVKKFSQEIMAEIEPPIQQTLKERNLQMADNTLDQAASNPLPQTKAADSTLPEVMEVQTATSTTPGTNAAQATIKSAAASIAADASVMPAINTVQAAATASMTEADKTQTAKKEAAVTAADPTKEKGANQKLTLKNVYNELNDKIDALTADNMQLRNMMSDLQQELQSLKQQQLLPAENRSSISTAAQESVRAYFNEIKEECYSMKVAVNTQFDKLEETLNQAQEKILNNIQKADNYINSVPDKVTSKLDQIKESVKTKLSNMKNTVKEIGNLTKDFIQNAKENKAALKAARKAAKENYKESKQDNKTNYKQSVKAAVKQKNLKQKQLIPQR